MKVAIYHRMAVPDPDSVTGPDELWKQGFKNFISEHPSWELADIFVDYGMNTTSFDRMVDDCVSKNIKVVIVHTISRFSRNLVISFEMISRLKDLGIGVYFLQEKIYSMDDTYTILDSIRNLLALEESANKTPNMPDTDSCRFKDGTYERN